MKTKPLHPQPNEIFWIMLANPDGTPNEDAQIYIKVNKGFYTLTKYRVGACLFKGRQNTEKLITELCADEKCKDIRLAAVDVYHLFIKKELQTSKEWYKNTKVEIVEPNGWDLDNFKFSWEEELIDEKEYNKRLYESKVKKIRFNLR